MYDGKTYYTQGYITKKIECLMTLVISQHALVPPPRVRNLYRQHPWQVDQRCVQGFGYTHQYNINKIRCYTYIRAHSHICIIHAFVTTIKA